MNPDGRVVVRVRTRAGLQAIDLSNGEWAPFATRLSPGQTLVEPRRELVLTSIRPVGLERVTVHKYADAKAAGSAQAWERSQAIVATIDTAAEREAFRELAALCAAAPTEAVLSACLARVLPDLPAPVFVASLEALVAETPAPAEGFVVLAGLARLLY